LRQAGCSYSQILEALPRPVSKSTLSLWLRDVELTPDQQAALNRMHLDARRRAGETRRFDTAQRRQKTVSAARIQIQQMSERDLFVVGVVAYWAEGSKAKPWRPEGEAVQFINSDPDMIRLFVTWLRLVGVGPERLSCRVHIHESGDAVEATKYWAGVAGVSPDSFSRPTIKRHRPTTSRGNVGAEYRGCLCIYVRRSTNLYRQIEGWWSGICAGLVGIGG
jgi:hypothetical protein